MQEPENEKKNIVIPKVAGILLFYRIVTVPTSTPGQTTTLCCALIIRRALKVTGVRMVSALEHHSHVFPVKSVTMTRAA